MQAAVWSQDPEQSIGRRGLPTFVGREADLRALQRLLWSDGARLVTIWGPPGVGKTRVAQELRWTVGPGQAETHLVDLRRLVHPGQIVSELSRHVGAGADAPRSLEALIRLVDRRSLLLVLDNCEHLLPEAGNVSGQEAWHFLVELMQSTPRLRVLATSQRLLRIPALERLEHAYRLLPLDGPDVNRHSSQTLQAPAARLFCEHAGLDPGSLSRGEAMAVSRICQALGGIPIYLELAGSRARRDGLTLAELERQLGEPLALLGRSGQRADAHASLTALLDWSCAALPGARTTAVLQRLALFRGRWTDAMARQVCSGELISERAVSAAIQTGLERCLLDEHRDGNQVSYSFHGAVRAYFRQRLEPATVDRVMARTTAYLIDLIAVERPLLQGRSQLSSLQALRLQEPTLDDALAWCAADPARAEQLASLVARSSWFWWLSGTILEKESWLVLAQQVDRVKPTERIRILNALGVVYQNRGRSREAVPLHREALELSLSIGDEARATRSECRLAIALMDLQEYEQSEGLLARSLARCERLGDPWHLSIVRRALGRVILQRASLQRQQLGPRGYRHWHADAVRAREYLDQALQGAYQVCDPHEIALSIRYRAEYDLHHGRGMKRIEERLLEALTILRDIDDRVCLVRCLELLAASPLVQKDAARALKRRAGWIVELASAAAGFSRAFGSSREDHLLAPAERRVAELLSDPRLEHHRKLGESLTLTEIVDRVLGQQQLTYTPSPAQRMTLIQLGLKVIHFELLHRLEAGQRWQEICADLGIEQATFFAKMTELRNGLQLPRNCSLDHVLQAASDYQLLTRRPV